jgi:hypothetical protein
MKIAFLGNCQLNNVGILFARMAQQKFIDAEIIWTKPIFELANNDYLPLFHALDRADVIYHQYHDTYHEMYATNHLSKYFKFKIVPTLESFVSTPQMNSWSDRTVIPYNLGFIDFRILDLYLQKIEMRRAGEIYSEAAINEDVVRALIDTSVFKYRDKFERKLICFNYAPFYREMMQKDVESYYTMNHPSNVHLQWLVNNILADAGFKGRLALDKAVPELLNQFLPPSLRNLSRKGKYILNAVPMELTTAIKMYYAYFDMLDPQFLQKELEASTYQAICSGQPQDEIGIAAQNCEASALKCESVEALASIA